MRDSDESLLKSYAENRDEVAFRLLADRYLGLIFHTALRRTSNRPLAEEISQNILCALAKKASPLAKNPDLLPAWLHRATLFEASKAMRSESSHQRRKQLQHPDEIPPTDEPRSSPWSDAVPHLDVALDQLPESDRGILMLHYFEKRSFPIIARSLGKNPAAIQKQAQRALEKLARLLRSRGVALSVTAVGAGLTSEFAKAAPVALLQSATTAVLTGSATYSTTGLTLMLATKSKALIPLVLLLFAVPLAFQQIAISKVKTHNDELRAKTYLVDRGDSTSRRVAASVRKPGVSTNLDILVLLDEQKEVLRLGGPRANAFEKKLAALEPETLVRLIREGAALRVNREPKGYLLSSLVAALAKKDARLAITTAVDLMESDRSAANAFGSRGDLPDYFAIWAKADPAGAKVWLEEKERLENFNNRSTTNGMAFDEFRSRLVAAMIAINSPGLPEFLLARPEHERSRLVMDSIRSVNRSGGENAAPVLTAFIPVIRGLATEGEREDAWVEVARKLIGYFKDEYSAATRFFAEAALAPAEKEILARATAETILGTHRSPPDPAVEARVLAETDAFLRQVIPEQADEILEGAKAKAVEGELRDAKLRIKRLRNHPDATDEEMVRELNQYNFRSQLPEALKIAERIKDPAKRAATLEVLNRRR